MIEGKRPNLTMIAGAVIVAATGTAAAQARGPMVAPAGGERDLFDVGLPDPGWKMHFVFGRSF